MARNSVENITGYEKGRMNKATLHFSAGQYEYIEVEITGTSEDIIRKWFEFKEKFEARRKEDLETNKPF